MCVDCVPAINEICYAFSFVSDLESQLSDLISITSWSKCNPIRRFLGFQSSRSRREWWIWMWMWMGMGMGAAKIGHKLSISISPARVQSQVFRSAGNSIKASKCRNVIEVDKQTFSATQAQLAIAKLKLKTVFVFSMPCSCGFKGVYGVQEMLGRYLSRCLIN